MFTLKASNHTIPSPSNARFEVNTPYFHPNFHINNDTNKTIYSSNQMHQKKNLLQRKFFLKIPVIFRHIIIILQQARFSFQIPPSFPLLPPVLAIFPRLPNRSGL